MRERLVGALVLLCIGVVLWSMLFTGTVEHKVDRRTQIPPPIIIDRPALSEPRQPQGIRPVPDHIRNPQPQRDVVVDDAPPPEAAQADAETAAQASPATDKAALAEASPKPEPAPAKPAPQPVKAEPPKTRPALDQDTRLPEAWVVQVGTFGSKENATNLKEKLQKDGHKAYLKSLKTKKATLYRVLVGPVLVEADANKIRDDIAVKHKLKPIVQRFDR